MAESRQAWEQVGQHFSDLGQRVRQHYAEQAGAEQAAPADRGKVDQRKVDDALRQVADSLDRAFTALGDAIRDPEFGEQTRKAANSLSDALSSTFAEVSERMGARRDRERRPPTAG